MTYNLLTIQELNNPPENDDLYPIFAEDWSLQRDEGENIVWEGDASSVFAKLSGGGRWNVDNTELIVTNKRLVYICHKFKKGSKWWGLGGGGAVIALSLRATSAAVAAYQRQSKAAVGHIRYQWPTIVIHETSKSEPILGTGNNAIAITMKDGNSQLCSVKFRMSKQQCEEVTPILIRQIAVFRADRDFDPKNYPNEDPKEVERVKAIALQRMTAKNKTQDKKTSTLDIYAVGKSMPVPRLR